MASAHDNPYDAVIADLERKRAEIDKLIESLRAFQGVSHIIPTSAENSIPNLLSLPDQENRAAFSKENPLALRPDGEFARMNVADAAKIILERAGGPLGNQDILDALEEGGFHSRSQQPLNTIGSILSRRASEVGDIVRVGRGLWALAGINPATDLTPLSE